MQVILWRVNVLCLGTQCHTSRHNIQLIRQRMQWTGHVVYMGGNRNVVSV